MVTDNFVYMQIDNSYLQTGKLSEKEICNIMRF